MTKPKPKPKKPLVCAVCGHKLKPWEIPQDVKLGGEVMQVTAVCDECARIRQ